MTETKHHGRTSEEIQATTLPKALNLWMQASSARDQIVRALGLEPRSASTKDAVALARALRGYWDANGEGK